MARNVSINLNAGRTIVDCAKVARNLGVIKSNIIDAARRALTDLSEEMLGDSQSRIKNRTGDLSASGTTEPAVLQGDKLISTWGFNRRYAAMRDRGGEIRPVNGRALAIPLGPTLTAAGVARFSSPREDAGSQGRGLFMVKIFGKVFLCEMIGRGQTSRLSFRWMLVPRVVQKGDGFVSNVVKEQAPRVAPTIAQYVKQGMGGGT